MTSIKELAIQACRAQEDMYLMKAFEAHDAGAIDLRDEILKWAAERREAEKVFEARCD